MLGFFIGTACLLGLVVVARRGRRQGRHGRWGGSRFFHRVLERLDTTPGQEKAIRNALQRLKQQAWDLRDEVKQTRADIAAALRAPELDKALLDRVFVKHDEALEKLRASTMLAAEQVHDTLDEQQRRKLADLIESGPGWGHARC